MRRILLLASIATACHAAPRAAPRPALGVEQSPVAAARPTVDTQPSFVPYVEEVDLDKDVFGNHIVRRFAGDFALIESVTNKGERKLLRISELEVLPFPAFVGAPEGRVTFREILDANIVIAMFETAGRVSFQLLRLDSMRWEDVGSFDLPASALRPQQDRTKSPAWLSVGKTITLQLSDGIETKAVHRLDLETLVWSPVAEKVALDPCVMSMELEEDLVRWGIDPAGKGKAMDCVLVRRSVSDPWTRIDDPRHELLFMRQLHRIDADRVLVTGGVTFKLFPFVQRNDVVDLDKMEVRFIDDSQLGDRMVVPDEPFLWMRSGTITRFDPATEAFVDSPGPELGFQIRWSLQLDERTYLFGGAPKGSKEWQFARMGFRPQ